MRSTFLLLPAVLLCACELTTGLSSLEKDPDFNPDAAVTATDTGTASDTTVAGDTMTAGDTMVATDSGMMATDSGVDTGKPADTGTCTEPEGKTVGTKCYFPIKTLMSWTEARDACKAKGGRLAIIKSMALNEALATIDMLSERWIGLSKPVPADTNTKDKYKWIDGSAFDPAGFDGFAVGEPNDMSASMDPAARLKPSDPAWYDRPGSTGTTAGIHALCEK